MVRGNQIEDRHEAGGNRDMWQRSCAVVAGGVSSNMRARGVPRPLIVRRAAGSHLWDVEDNELVDVNMGYGCHLFGYGAGGFSETVGRQFGLGSMTGLPHEVDHRAAGLIVEMVPGAHKVRFANSGTEAVASALRLARMLTGRQRILTFFGHYHGWSEAIMRAGVAAGPKGQKPRPGAPGMTEGALGQVCEAIWNDEPSVREAFAGGGTDIAAVVLEPVAANAGVIPPQPGFLQFVRDIAHRNGSLVIFDEVITGFRVSQGGAAKHYSVVPDMTILSKAMGAGFPVSAIAGTAEVMAPLERNEAFHAGVYAGNHAALAVVAAVLDAIKRHNGLYEELEHIGASMEQAIAKAFADVGQAVWTGRVGSLLSVACTEEVPGPVVSPGHQPVAYARHLALQMAAQARGVYFHPDPLEPWFLSTAHGDREIQRVAEILGDALTATAGAVSGA